MSVSSDSNSTASGGGGGPASKSRGAGGSERRARRLKVVLRRLPYGMTEPELNEQLEPLPASVVRRWFRAADRELLPFAFSRAYLVFDSEPDAISFCERFNGYVFVDKMGNESMAIAEQAPFPDVPKRRDGGCERDRRMNTLDSDAEYQKFLAEYNSAVVRRVTDFDGLLREIDERHRAERLVKSTPLTEFVDRYLTGRLDRRVAARVGGGRVRAEKSSGRPVAVVPSAQSKKGPPASRRGARNEWVEETAAAASSGRGGEPPEGRDGPRRRDRRKKPAQPAKTEGEEPPVERKRILRRNDERPAADADSASAAETQSNLERRRPLQRTVEPTERRDGGGGGRRGPRFSDRVAQHQQMQQQQQAPSSSAAATATFGNVKDSAADVSPAKAIDSESSDNRRRRDRRRWPRGEKPAGGIAVAVLRSLKAERSGAPGAKESAHSGT